MSYAVSAITPRIAARLNDSAQTVFTNTVLLPFVKDACDELQLELEIKGLLVLEKKSAAIVIPAGRTQLGATVSLIPTDMLEPQKLEERLSGSTDKYFPMVRREWEPDLTQTDSLRYWSYREEDIFFVGATTARDVRIYYLKRAITVASVSDIIAINNSEQFMINRVAALAAEFIGENKTRADSLNQMAIIALDKLTGIGQKSKQGTRTRRRPFTLSGRRRWA